MISQPNQAVKLVISEYSEKALDFFHLLRAEVFEVAKKHELGDIEETLKWGEPAYLAKGGSTLRIAWKEKSPDNICIYFNCNTILVETFREVFFDVFEFEGKRAIKLNLNSALPIKELKQCIATTLRYHKVKHLPLLGF